MREIIERIAEAVHMLIDKIIQTNQGQLKPVPDHILGLTLYLCLSVLIQGIADLIIKGLSYTTILPSMPWRTDFLFLTAISVLMGYRTLTGMRRRKFDVTRNSIELGFLVEIALVAGDAEFIYKNITEIPEILWIRLPFIVLTIINIGILMYSYRTLDLQR